MLPELFRGKTRWEDLKTILLSASSRPLMEDTSLEAQQNRSAMVVLMATSLKLTAPARSFGRKPSAPAGKINSFLFTRPLMADMSPADSVVPEQRMPIL